MTHTKESPEFPGRFISSPKFSVRTLVPQCLNWVVICRLLQFPQRPVCAVLGISSTFSERLFSVYTQFYALSTYDGLAPDCFCFDVQRIFKWSG